MPTEAKSLETFDAELFHAIAREATRQEEHIELIVVLNFSISESE